MRNSTFSDSSLEARGSFSGLRVEVLKLQSRIQVNNESIFMG